MNLKEALLFVYGVIFATSTPYLKPKKRFLFPTATWKVDADFTVFLGGAGICAHLRGEPPLLVNANLASAASQWKSDLSSIAPFEGATLVLSSLNGAFGSVETVGALNPSRVLVGGPTEEWASLPVERVSSETVLKVGSETVRLIPVSGGPTESDLVIFFETRSVMMFGAMFTNRIHPVLQHGVAARVPSWIASLESLIERFQPRTCIPAEGEVGTVDDVREFIRYLRALIDESVEFSYCRKNFDWMEIPSATSLEENFDTLRRNVKTHTSIR